MASERVKGRKTTDGSSMSLVIERAGQLLDEDLAGLPIARAKPWPSPQRGGCLPHRPLGGGGRKRRDRGYWRTDGIAKHPDGQARALRPKGQVARLHKRWRWVQLWVRGLGGQRLVALAGVHGGLRRGRPVHGRPRATDSGTVLRPQRRRREHGLALQRRVRRGPCEGEKA